jgi:Carboxypeptidase regulatory-like domain/PDZ domain
VVDDRGSGLPKFTLGIESFAAHAEDLDRGPRTYEDVRGAFRWDKLAPGRYVLTASVEGRATTRSGSIAVQGGVPTRGVRILVPQGGSVEGRIYDEHHALLSGVDVAFDSVSSVVESGRGTKTDESGRYRLDGAPTGVFTVLAHRDGFRTRLVSGLRVASGKTLTADIALAAAGPGRGFELGGIGANVAMTRDGLAFAGVGPGDPSGRAGLEADDRILSIDGDAADSMSVADAVQLLRGEPGTSVGVSVMRPKTGQVLDVVIERGTIVR